MTKSWQSLNERSNPLALKLIRWIALNLGRPVARLLFYPITFYFLVFASEQRKASRLYLNRVLGRKVNYLDIAKHIHSFASTILDRVYLLTAQFEKLDVQFPKENMPLKFSQQGRGCILLGSHIGSFEVLRSYAVRKCPLPIKILMYEGHNPNIMKVLNALNPDLSDMIIPLGDPDSLLQVKDAVDSGKVVGMMGDRIGEMDGHKTALCSLLGNEIELPAAPILIASALKVPVVIFFGIYLGGNRYKIHFELLSEEITLNRKSRQKDLQKYLQDYANIMEAQIKKAPFNWFNFYDYWREN